MQPVKRQHTVPRFYLKRFTNGEGQMWAYHNIEQKRIGPLDVESIAWEYDFYTVPTENALDEDERYIEEWFSMQEAHWDRLVDDLCAEVCVSRKGRSAFRRQVLHKSERDHFAHLLVYQWARTQGFRQLFPTLPDWDESSSTPLIHARVLAHPELRCYWEEIARQIWIVGVNPDPIARPLITSDDPVLYVPPDDSDTLIENGLLHEAHRFVFPLSSGVVLLVYERKRWARRSAGTGGRDLIELNGRAVHVDAPWVDELNRWQMEHCTRFAFSASPSFPMSMD